MKRFRRAALTPPSAVGDRKIGRVLMTKTRPSLSFVCNEHEAKKEEMKKKDRHREKNKTSREDER